MSRAVFKSIDTNGWNLSQILCPDFDLVQTLESGQVFGFEQCDDGAYVLEVCGSLCRFEQSGTILRLSSPSCIIDKEIRRYFDLDRDLNKVYQALDQIPAVQPVFRKVAGLRLIHQDSWEALAGFILASNNNIKRIKSIWKNLAVHFSGDAFRFPSPSAIARSEEALLRKLGLGYRAAYLLETSKIINRSVHFLDDVRAADYESGKKLLLALPGIGPKVADCILLYGFQKFESFPVDVWMLRTMRKIFFNSRPVPERQVASFGRRLWGNMAGYVQQYIFHCARLGLL